MNIDKKKNKEKNIEVDALNITIENWTCVYYYLVSTSPRGYVDLDVINKVINYDTFNFCALITGITGIMVIQYVDSLLHV
jgi:hypothetical protein